MVTLLANITDILSVFIFLKLCIQIDKAESTTGYSDLQALFFAARDGWGVGSIVEIGAYKGKSTICLAWGSRLAKREKVVSIDPHTGGTHAVYSGNLEKRCVKEYVKPYINTSEEARKVFNAPVRLLFIDGLHEYVWVRKDILLWKDLVIDGGLIIFHDYNWPGVRKAVDELLESREENFLAEIEVGCSIVISKGKRNNKELIEKISTFNKMKKFLAGN